jgi:hypothetical protein
MDAGRELDALIAEKVMGQPFRKPTHGTCCTCQTCGHGYDECQCGYSEYIEMAWQVVEKLRDMENHVRIECARDGYLVEINLDQVRLLSGTAPRAICLAALKAVE